TWCSPPRLPPGSSASGQRRPSVPRLALTGAAIGTFAAGTWAAVDPSRAGLSLLLVAIALIVGGASWMELGPGSAKELALIAALAGAAAAGRVLFAAIPGVQPVT